MLPYQNLIAVDAHRGNSKYTPENTLCAFRSALELKPDMLEIDLHMTKDGHIVMMHDHTVDRTTNGTGLIREKTLEEIKALDAGSWKDARFAGEKVPTFIEFLELMKGSPEMLFCVELKDYPHHSGNFAYESAVKSIDLLRQYGLLPRCVINTWSGELNEWLVEKYGSEIMIHAYHPQEAMGPHQKRFVYDYAYCVCMFGTALEPVVPKEHFNFAKSYGVEPWVYYPDDSEELIAKAIEYGARVITSNDPKRTLDYLRSKGLHK